MFPIITLISFLHFSGSLRLLIIFVYLTASNNQRPTLNPSVHLALQRLQGPVNTWETEHKVQRGFREEKGRGKNDKSQAPIIICWNQWVIKEKSRREEPYTKIKTKAYEREQRLQASVNSLSLYPTDFYMHCFYFIFFLNVYFASNTFQIEIQYP